MKRKYNTEAEEFDRIIKLIPEDVQAVLDFNLVRKYL